MEQQRPDEETVLSIVFGATGLAGSHVVRTLLTKDAGSPGNDIIVTVSRSVPPAAGNAPPAVRHVVADLLRSDAEATVAGGVRDAWTGEASGSGAGPARVHVYFCAWSPSIDDAGHGEMLRNAVGAVARAFPDVARTHVCLLAGSKQYGVHLGPAHYAEYAVPFREAEYEGDWPGTAPSPGRLFEQASARAAAPLKKPCESFYLAMEGFLRNWSRNGEQGEGNRLTRTVSIARPFTIIGAGQAHPLNFGTSLAVYASVLHLAGQPLVFPGTAASYRSIVEASDAGLLARAMVRSARDARFANTCFNAVNGDAFTWGALWPALGATAAGSFVGPGPDRDAWAAQFGETFGVDPGTILVRPGSSRDPYIDVDALLAAIDAPALWAQAAREQGLRCGHLADVLNSKFLSFVLRRDWNVLSSTFRLRALGFDEQVDSLNMYLTLFADLVADHFLPRPPGGKGGREDRGALC